MIELMKSASERIGKRDIAIAVVAEPARRALMYHQRRGSAAASRGRQAAIHVGNLLPYALALPLFLLVTVPLLWRRAAPLAALAAAFGGLVVNELLSAPR